MRIVRLVSLFVVLGVLVLMAMPSVSEAVCACSGIGQSNGSYATPSAYGSYGYGYGGTYGPQQPQARPVQSKAGKSKKKASKSKPVAQ